MFPYQIFAFVAFVFTLVAFAYRLRIFNALARPVDRTPPKADPGRGVRYAFTLGLAPWAKESTRRHWVAYLRGIGFHVMIFLGLGLFLLSPWLEAFSVTLRYALAIFVGLGAVLGLAGFVARWVEPNLKALSTPDDYFAVLVVTVFLSALAISLVDLARLPLFYVASAVMLIYVPLGKIRHCLYFAYSRLFFGKMFGRRGVLPHGSAPHPQHSR
jgi:nitrate reductase gamma subunit